MLTHKPNHLLRSTIEKLIIFYRYQISSFLRVNFLSRKREKIKLNLFKYYNFVTLLYMQSLNEKINYFFTLNIFKIGYSWTCSWLIMSFNHDFNLFLDIIKISHNANLKYVCICCFETDFKKENFLFIEIVNRLRCIKIL